MKILAIHGKNLASLAGEFEVDFRAEPLASTGLFAICGPTGAGKSTLLDALCLALYDDTPRLAKAGVRGMSLPDVRGETITPRDSRNLLRRGTAEGYAEVDFIGNDGVEYRARWSVRRARSKTDGKLQNAEMSLTRLFDQQPIGNLKSEVLQAIHERLGLTFEQFNRAVLLAQNEFSAFLKADDNERAELLETLTGTDTYTVISMRAYERAKAEQEALERLQVQLADQQPLDAETRAQTEQALSEARAATAQREARKAELDGHLRWHGAWENYKEACQKATEDLHHALAEREAAAPRRRQLERVESVQEARFRVAELDRTTQELGRSRMNAAAAEQQRAFADKRREAAEIALIQARHAVAEAERARLAAHADLDLARTLDAQIKAIMPNHGQVESALHEAREAEADARAALETKQSERAQTQQGIERTSDWLISQHAQLQPLAEGWPRWDTLLTQAGRLIAEASDAAEALARAQQAEAACRQAAADAAVNLGRVGKALQAAQANHTSAVRVCAAFDAESSATRRKLAEERRDQLLSAEQLWRDLAATLARRAEMDETANGLRKAIRQSELALAQVQERRPTVVTALEQAERSLKIAETACAESVETLRESLEPHVPCPVCGSTEHPYATEHPQLRAALNGLMAEVERWRQEAKALEQQAATHATLTEQHEQQLAEIERTLGTLVCAIESESAKWHIHPVATEVAEVKAGDRIGWFTQERSVIQGQLNQIRQEETAWRAASKAKDAAQAALNGAREQYGAAQHADTAAKSAVEQALLEVKAANERLRDINQRLEQLLQELDGVLVAVDWRERWKAAPDRIYQSLKKQAHHWLAQRELIDKLQGRLATLDAEIRALTQTLTKAAEQLKGASAAFEQITRELTAKRTERQALFEGHTVTEIEAAFAQAIDTARAAMGKQEQAYQDALAEHIRATQALTQVASQLEERTQAAELAEAALNDWITTYNTHAIGEMPLNVEELHRLLAYNGQWLAREHERLQAVDKAVQRAETILAEREAKRVEHESARPTLETAETIRQAQAILVTELEAAKRQVMELELALRQDDARRERSAALLEQLQAQAATAMLWAQLNELIGSADGKKFRNYAQQLTLDVLLGYANRHLASLSRRYRLERIQNTLGLLVVDQDMADEVRSVHSLSGGESFLVSLALALALASLSSNRVQVESLFIDEGFGSLDADTLRVAMDALDALQAQGRKVGVISHVQEMTERIGTQIQVRRLAGGQSRIVVAAA